MTQDGKKEVFDYIEECGRSEELKRLYPTEKKYTEKRIESSKSKFYTPLPFVLSHEPCKLVDFRKQEEITTRLTDIIANGKADMSWL